MENTLTPTIEHLRGITEACIVHGVIRGITEDTILGGTTIGFRGIIPIITDGIVHGSSVVIMEDGMAVTTIIITITTKEVQATVHEDTRTTDMQELQEVWRGAVWA